MTVSQDLYGTRLDRKNIPPPLSLANFNYPSISLQQHHINITASTPSNVPKSAPPQATNNDLMQFQLQLMLQNESKTPGPNLQSQFSTPQSQFSTPPTLQSLQSQFSNSASLQNQFPTSASLQNQFSTPASLQSQFSTPANLQSQFSTPASLQSQFSTPGNMQTQFSTPANLQNLQTQFSTPSSLPSQYGSNLQLYNTPMSPMLPMGLDSPILPMGLDSPQQQQQEGKNNASRYKTELCRPYEENGSCKYGEKCQFAHGIHELRNLSRHPKYKTELCRTFHTIGFCPYGPRCHFIHNTEEKRAPPISPGPHNSGSNATLQNIPALLSLFQQSTNVNKVMTFLSKMQLQLGAKNTDEVLQYLNINSANLMTPPSTPNMFSFPEYMVPAAQALNQASRPSTSSAAAANSNIHSYFNFNLALKDQHLSGLLSAAQFHNPMLYAPPAGHSPAGTPPLQMPCLSAGTPPLSSSEGSPMSERSADLYSAHQQLRYENYHDNSGKLCYHDNSGKLGYHGELKLSAEYMVPGRVIAHSDHGFHDNHEYTTANGKRLPIFNQLSEPVC